MDDVHPSGKKVFAAEALNMLDALRAIGKIEKLPCDTDPYTFGAHLVPLDGFEMNRLSFGLAHYMPLEAMERLDYINSRTAATPAVMATSVEMAEFVADDLPVLKKGALALLHDAVTHGVMEDGSGRLKEAQMTMKLVRPKIMEMCSEYGFVNDCRCRQSV